MKLTKIAGIVVAVLGVTAVGGSWYTGQQVEAKYQDLIQLGNNSLKQLAAYGITAEIKDVQFQRHFFSSDVKYTLETQVDGQTYAFKGDDKLFHGPLPLNRLTKGNLSPVLASIESKIQLPENLKVYFEQQALLGKGQSDISYSGASTAEFNINPIRLTDGSLAISKSNYIYEYDPATKKAEAEVKAENVKFVDSEKIETEIQGLRYQFDTVSDKQYPLLTLGKYSVDMTSLKISDNEAAPFTMLFNHLTSTGKSTLEKDRVISSGDAKAEIEMQVDNNKVKLGQFKMDVLVDMDAQGMNDLTPYLSSPEKFESAEAGNVVQSIMMKSPKIEIKDLSFENGKGKNNLSLLLNLDKFDVNQMGSFDSILKIFRASYLDTKLNIASIEEFSSQVTQLEGVSKEEADQQAKLTVEELINQAKASTLAEVDNENIKMKLTIDQGKVNLNGRDVPKEEVEGALFILMLGLGSMGMQ
ncbi:MULTISPECIES: YdgA family protein [Glaesserella]|uniref:DUF945 domain-containing protein n=1 Tax=Glaesserella australis TaxID=2094024 RepID=A0A328BZR5_9PAST|nr:MULTISPECIES: YdgA family protein [Glaesserella]AUI65910.1 hypothetical protein CJD39_04675 [Glaesserella sp. 15-184]RAL18370.1 DUF945 domain-containing protein [Glaesserella australis]